jgi:hypothetical protein
MRVPSLVPPGRQTLSPVHIFEATSLRSPEFEDSGSTELAEVLPDVAPGLSDIAERRREFQTTGQSREDKAPHEQLQAATRVQFREGASNWVDTPFLQATTFEHERRTPNAERRKPNAKRQTPNAESPGEWSGACRFVSINSAGYFLEQNHRATFPLRNFSSGF